MHGIILNIVYLRFEKHKHIGIPPVVHRLYNRKLVLEERSLV